MGRNLSERCVCLCALAMVHFISLHSWHDLLFHTNIQLNIRMGKTHVYTLRVRRCEPTWDMMLCYAPLLLKVRPDTRRTHFARGMHHSTTTQYAQQRRRQNTTDISVYFFFVIPSQMLMRLNCFVLYTYHHNNRRRNALMLNVWRFRVVPQWSLECRFRGTPHTLSLSHTLAATARALIVSFHSSHRLLLFSKHWSTCQTAVGQLAQIHFISQRLSFKPGAGSGPWNTIIFHFEWIFFLSQECKTHVCARKHNSHDHCSGQTAENGTCKLEPHTSHPKRRTVGMEMNSMKCHFRIVLSESPAHLRMHGLIRRYYGLFHGQVNCM